MTGAEFQDLAIRHLLGETDAEEERRFRAELERRGEEGRAVVRDLRETLADLAFDAPPVAPPARLRERVMESVRQETGRGSREPPGSDPDDASVRELPGRTGGPWRWVSVAAAVLAVIAIGWALTLRSQHERLRAELTETRERLAAADAALDSLAEVRGDLELVSSPRTAVRGLGGTDAEPGAQARVFVDPATGRALLFAYDLPILPPDTVYELWAIEGETPRPAGVFRPDSTGRARLEIADRALIDGADALAVTAEPAPGTETPTGEMILVTSDS